jgi:hypothetical protein
LSIYPSWIQYYTFKTDCSPDFLRHSAYARFIFEDAGFSIATVKKLIRQGKEDTEKILAKENAE